MTDGARRHSFAPGKPAAAPLFAALLLAAFPFAAAGNADANADAARAALRSGNAREARNRFDAAVKLNPSSHELAIARAGVLPPADAIRVMDSLSKVPNIPAAAKAACLKFLGDHRFVKEDYKGAAALYAQAARADASPVYRHYHALALAMDNRAAQAAEIWRAIAEDPSDPMSAEAAQLVSQLKLPPSAAPPPPAQQPTPANPQAAPAQTAPTPTPAPPARQTTPAAQPTEIIFTVQVGAFGSKENADNLAKRLSGTYSDVTVSPTASGDQTLYRVRVGTFRTRDEAAAFADRLITGDGMSARVVEK